MGILLNIMEASIAGGMAVIVFAVLSFVFGRKSKKKYKMLIWCLIMLRFLIPLQSREQSVLVQLEVPVYRLNEVSNSTTELPVDSAEQVMNELSNVAVDKSKSHRLTSGNIMVLAWGMGTFLFFSYYVFTQRRVFEKLRKKSSLCIDEQMLHQAKGLSKKIGLKECPQIYIMADKKISPFSAGLFKNKIYLPDTEYSKKDLEYILQHELIHCKNHDILIKGLVIFVNGIHWFNPFVWLMRVLINQDIELICDEKVLSTATKEERREYSEIIMSCISAGATKAALTTGYVQGTRFIKYRFDNIFMVEKRRTSIVSVIGTLLVMLFVSNGLRMTEVLAETKQCDIPICYGIEIRTDVDSNGTEERVYVKDCIGLDETYTQLVVQFSNGTKDFTNYSGYWNSYMVSGDLNADGVTEIVLFRSSVGSAYGLGEVNVLQIENQKWYEIPNVFIKNPDLQEEQPEDFIARQFGVSCVAATIVETDGRKLLRLIMDEDITEDVVKCIDCSWTEEGWYIENIQMIMDYYAEYKDMELLENNLLK
ncbi:MAG: hypothetical protein J6J42_04500 [Lachnospiraceae bacterium]|nr:hypothetical protein [Lachnospiraceae bacterium]